MIRRQLRIVDAKTADPRCHLFAGFHVARFAGIGGIDWSARLLRRIVKQRPGAVGLHECKEALLNQILMKRHSARFAGMHCRTARSGPPRLARSAGLEGSNPNPKYRPFILRGSLRWHLRTTESS